MRIDIKNIIGTSNAISQSDGHVLYQRLEKENLTGIIIDFNNIQFLSTAFLNASIGRLAQRYPFDFMQKINYIIPDGRDVFKSKIDRVLSNAALGDYYNQIVDEATS